MSKFLQLMFACHRIPERSFFFRGKPFPICARCTGILLGYIAGITYAMVFGAIPLAVAVLFLLPLALDGGLQYAGILKSTNIRRLLTGIFAGVGTDFIIYGIAVLGFNHGREVTRYLESLL